MIYKPNLYTQTAYANRIGLTQARVNQMIKEKRLPDNARAVKITGGVIIEEKKS